MGNRRQSKQNGTFTFSALEWVTSSLERRAAEKSFKKILNKSLCFPQFSRLILHLLYNLNISLMREK